MTEKQLQDQMNRKDGPKRVILDGIIKLTVRRDATIYIGKQFVKGAIAIERPRITIDGTNALLEVNVESCNQTDCSLFCVMPSAYDVRLLNLTIDITFPACSDLPHMFSVIYNAAFGLQMENCRIRVRSQAQTDLVIIYNNGNLDTHLGTRADNLVISDCFLEAVCDPELPLKKYTVYGLYNNLANSISMRDTHIFVSSKGNGANQRAVGVYTSGRFGRFVGNNIKANGAHNLGKELEHAHAAGVINEGLHNLFTANNVIGECAGEAVAFINQGMYAEISSNKLLATHTIKGIALFNKGFESLITGNVIVSSSRNARLLVNAGEFCMVSHNALDVFMGQDQCKSGCGIYLPQGAKDNIIAENLIRNVLDCALFADANCGTIHGNRCVGCGAQIVYTSDLRMAEKLDERRIKSLYE